MTTMPAADTSRDSAAPTTVPSRTGRIALAFAAMLTLTVAVRMADPTGWLGSDDSSYFNAAEHVLDGQTIRRVHHHSARSTMVLPIVASVALLGSTPAAVILPTLIASVLCVIVVALIGRLLWGWREGLLAATIIAVLPYFRVLSTAAFPDVHACLWTASAVAFGLTAVRAERRRWRRAGWVGAGMAVGIACSAKIFAVITGGTVVMIACLYAGRTGRERATAVILIAIGAAAALVADGLFYAWAADDFWFKLHALRSTQQAGRFFPEVGYYEADAFGQLVWQRLTLLFDPARSGWGWVGFLFWPAAVAACVNRWGRVMLFWAASFYFLVAFVPVSATERWHPYPQFDGRHALPAAIPLALCLACLIGGVARHLRRPGWTNGLVVATAMALVLVSYARPNDLNGFRYRATAQLARGVQQIVDIESWDNDREVFMSPSMYKRFHILFPPSLRPRLRVAADEDARDWWRHAALRIEDRCRPLPRPGRAYLLATPRQLRGEPEFWDYGVALPRDALKPWQATPPRITLSRFADKSVRPVPPSAEEGTPVLLLLSGPVTPPTLAGRDHAGRHADR